MGRGRKIIDKTGNVYGQLTVLALAERREGKPVEWLCECTCGNHTIVTTSNLINNHTLSCGCRQSNNLLGGMRTTHGMSGAGHRIYHSWCGLLARTGNPNDHKWDHYGGRGIKVCDAWKVFENFYADMGPSWVEGLSLDRIDVNGDYEPSNCRWATRAVQSHNRRKFKGKSSKYYGVSWHKLKRKWSTCIRVDGVLIHLGDFLDELSAAAVYDNASERYYGDRPNSTVGDE